MKKLLLSIVVFFALVLFFNVFVKSSSAQTAPPAPPNLAGTCVDATHVNFHWSPAIRADLYKLYISPWTGSYNYQGAATNVTLPVPANTNINVNVRGYDNAGGGDGPYDTITFNTSQCAPAPSGVSSAPTATNTPTPTTASSGSVITSVTAVPSCAAGGISQANLSWSPAVLSVGGAAVVGYHVRWYNDATNPHDFYPTPNTRQNYTIGSSTLPLPDGQSIRGYVEAYTGSTSSPVVQTGTRASWTAFTASNCTGTTGSPSTAPTQTTHYTINGKVFIDKDYSGNVSAGTGMSGVGVTVGGDLGWIVSTDANGNYSIDTGKTSGSYNVQVSITIPSGYSVAPKTAAVVQNFSTNATTITQAITLNSTTHNVTANFGLATPPSTVSLGTGPNSITGGVWVGAVGTPAPLSTIAFQGGDSVDPINQVTGMTSQNIVTTKGGTYSVTGLPNNSNFVYTETLAVPNPYTIKQVLFNGSTVSLWSGGTLGGINPVKIFFTAPNTTGWNTALMHCIPSTQSPPCASGVFYWEGQNQLFVDPAKNPSGIKVDIILNPCGAGEDCSQTQGYWLIGYPNGGMYCLPVHTGGQVVSACASMGTTFPGGANVAGNGGGTSPTATTAPSPTQTPTNQCVDNPVDAVGTTCTSAPNVCSGQGTKTQTCHNSAGTQITLFNVPCSNASTACSAGLTCANGTCTNANPTATVTTGPTVTTAPTGTSGACVDFFTWFNKAFYTDGGHTPGQGYSAQTYYDFLFARGGANLVTTAANQGLFGVPDNTASGAPAGTFNNVTVSGTTTGSSGSFTYRAWRNGALVKEQTFSCPDFDAIAFNKYYVGNPTGGGAGPVLYGSIPGTPSTCGGQISNGVSTPFLTPEQGTAPTATCLASPTPTGTVSTPTPTITPTLGPTITPTPTPTFAPNATVFKFTVGLDGVGTTGDNVTPNVSTGSNKNPKHPTRNLTVEVYDGSNNLVTSKTGNVVYDSTTTSPTYGKFTGTVDMGSLASGNYTIKIKSDGYLRRIIPGIQSVAGSQTTALPTTTLVAGDIFSDNTINIQDYNVLTSCWVFNNNSDNGLLCNQNASYKTMSDLNDDGSVDQTDYNLFLREYAVQNGQ